MAPSDHALLSASGAHRWLNCTPSAVLESREPDSPSDAAEQGTVAHALAEWKLRRALNDAPTFKPESGWVDEEMEHLTDDYVSFVQEHISLARETYADPQVLIEQRLDFSHVVPGGFGTGDCVIIAEPKLQIIDLKYGQGVLVEAERNPQLMLYALGALLTFGDLYDITDVAVTIYQPRRGNVDTWETSVTALKAFIASVLGIDEFDDDVFTERIDHIDVAGKDHYTFHYTDGTTSRHTWRPNLKKSSWTPAKKAAWAELVKARWEYARAHGLDGRSAPTPPEALAKYRAVAKAEAERLRAERGER